MATARSRRGAPLVAATGPPGRPLINPPRLAAAINRTAQRATPAGAVATVLATSLALLLLLGGGYLETRAIGSHHARKALLHRLQEGGAGGEATHLHSPGGDQTIQFRASDGWARGEYTSTSGDGPNIAAGVAQWAAPRLPVLGKRPSIFAQPDDEDGVGGEASAEAAEAALAVPLSGRQRMAAAGYLASGAQLDGSGMSAFDRSAATLAADHRWAKRAAIRGHRRAEEPRQVVQRPARLASLEAPPLLRPERSPRDEQHPPMADPALVLFCGGGDDGSALASALASLTRTPGLAAFVVYLAQDGNDVGLVSSLASEAVRATGVLAAPVSRGALHLQRPRAPADGSDESQHGALAAAIRRWALDTVLGEHQRSHALLVDDRMAFAADFLQLFQATAWLLDMDEEGLWCVSAWNDYGFEDWEWSEAGLMRSDYFSGVAWMTTAKVWGELGPTFPGSNWADWMRASPLRAGRQCIVPHLNRVQLVGPAASENPLDRPTSDMAFFGGEQQPGRFANVAHLLPEAYRARLERLGRLAMAHHLPWPSDTGALTAALAAPAPGQVYMIVYKAKDFALLAQQLQLGEPHLKLSFQGVTELPLASGPTLLLVRSDALTR